MGYFLGFKFGLNIGMLEVFKKCDTFSIMNTKEMNLN